MIHLKAVVFDWAGTMIDFGSRAPMGVFVRAFAQFSIDISVAEARGPMGMAKRDHIEHLLANPRIAAAWAARHGHPPTKRDVDRIYEVFVPLNVAVAAEFADMIPGAVEAACIVRARGLKIGSTTGYTREIMAPILPKAEAAGYAPDSLVCAGDVPEGRPSPLMIYRTMADLGVYPPAAVVKVDDTIPGIGEGLAAGTWTVGVTASGNEVGLSLEEWRQLKPAARREATTKAEAVLRRAGAHYVIETVADLPPVLDLIETRLATGEAPPQADPSTKAMSKRRHS
jgi:phosphonoacetaldehyde hydrolase